MDKSSVRNPARLVDTQTWSMVASNLKINDLSPVTERRHDYRIRQDDLLSLMQVNKTLCVAATPHLNTRVHVKDLAAFFLGAQDGGAEDYTSGRRMINNGRFKNFALHHVRHLCLITDYGIIHDVPTRRDLPEVVIAAQDEEFYQNALRTTTSINWAVESLARYASLPNLVSIQTGQRDYQKTYSEPLWLEAEPRILAPLVMRKCQPRYWCRYNSSGAFSYPLQTRPAEFDQGVLPSLHVAHTNVGDAFSVLWGTRNRIIVDDDVEGLSLVREMRCAGLVSWMVNNLAASYPAWLDEVQSPIKKEVIKQTALEVYGLARYWPMEGPESPNVEELDTLGIDAPTYAELVKDESEVTKEMESLVQKGCEARLSFTSEDAKRVVKVFKFDEAGVCPSCLESHG